MSAMMLGVVSACSGDGADAALSLPPADGGRTVTRALADEGSGDWVRGFIVAVRGEPVRLCEALAESQPSQCAGSSLILRDGVIWREPTEETAVIGSVADGLLTSGVGDAQRCGYEPAGPCAAFPGIVTSAGVLWTDVEYSVIGTIHDGELGAPQAPPGADL